MDTNTQLTPAQTPPAAKVKKPIYKRWWAIALAAIFTIVVISQATGGGDTATPAADKPAASQPAEKVQPKAEEPVKEAPKLTAAQENAVESAQNYLDTLPFSRKGLIEQLSSDAGAGFSVKDATFAADHINANWNDEAAEAAESYLDTLPFSRKGLIEQLSSDAGAGFSVKEATLAVDQLKVNWNEEAAEAAKSYLDTMAFSARASSSSCPRTQVPASPSSRPPTEWTKLASEPTD